MRFRCLAGFAVAVTCTLLLVGCSSAATGAHQVKAHASGPSFLDYFTATASAVAGIGTVAAVLVAVAALRTARSTVLFDHAIDALGSLLASVKAMARTSYGQYGQLDEDLLTARSSEEFAAPYFALTADIERVKLMLPALTDEIERFEWLLNSLNNLGSNLLQAWEFSEFDLSPDDADRPAWVDDDSDWAYLQASTMYGLLYALYQDLGEPPSFAVEHQTGVLERWGREILEAKAAGYDRNVYANTSSYLTQSTRLLEDFTREYLAPELRHLLSGKKSRTSRA